jgi:FMN phosphatase YigB (HAD superfamily)
MATRVLLFDVDGVLFRNKHALKLIEERSTDFTRKFIPSFQPSPQLNYLKYGHTVQMINKITHTIGRVSTTTLEEYNEYVFNDSTLNQVARLVNDDDVTRGEMWKHVIVRSGQTPHIFSNAPDVWVQGVLSWASLENSFADSVIITPKSLYSLKPNPQSYEIMVDELQDDVSCVKDILFVDDSRANVNGALRAGIPAVQYTDEVDELLVGNYFYYYLNKLET